MKFWKFKVPLTVTTSKWRKRQPKQPFNLKIMSWMTSRRILCFWSKLKSLTSHGRCHNSSFFILFSVLSFAPFVPKLITQFECTVCGWKLTSMAITPRWLPFILNSTITSWHTRWVSTRSTESPLFLPLPSFLFLLPCSALIPRVYQEFVFVLDLSGSMKGENLADAKRWLIECIYQLPTASSSTSSSSASSCKFNVVVFGSTYDRLFVDSSAVNDNNKQQAIDFIQKLKASYGGTDLWRPLKSLYALSHTNKPRQIFLFSDGHVTDLDYTLEIVAENSKHTRMFTFGVGDTCSRHVIRTMAKRGSGSALFVGIRKLPNKKKIQRMFQQALQVRKRKASNVVF